MPQFLLLRYNLLMRMAILALVFWCAPHVGAQTLWRGSITTPDGSVVEITKTLDGGVVRASYALDDGIALTREQFQQFVRTSTPAVIAPSVQKAMSGQDPSALINLLVVHQFQPLSAAAMRFSAAYKPEISSIQKAFLAARTGAERRRLSLRFDALTHSMRGAIGSSVQAALRQERASLATWVNEVGGVITNAPSGFGLLGIRIPINLVKQLGQRSEVREVVLDSVAESQLDNSTHAIRAFRFWDNGIDGGQSAFDPAMLDSGMDVGHPGFSGLGVLYHIDHGVASTLSDYNDSWSNPDDFAGHGTHVAGIVCGRGSLTWEQHKGVAPGTTRFFNLKSAFRRTSGSTGLVMSDAIDNIDWGIYLSKTDDIDLLNFSYGLPAISDDAQLARFMDAVVDDLNIPITVAAGNSGPNSWTLVNPATAYNVLSVASMNDMGTPSRSDDVISLSSSRGPTPGGRKKPDITAPGSFITSPTKDWETNPDYLYVSGTSYAAPHVLGGVQLLMDSYGPFADSKRVRAVLINTADSWGSPEWNNDYGWGYLNLRFAYNKRDAVFSRAVSPAGNPGDFDLFLGTFEPGDTATLVWNRHVNYDAGGVYPGVWYGLNDLDLRVYRHSDGTLLDWSTSGIDNTEQVTVSSGTIECVLRVDTSDTSFSAVSQENYALATPLGFTYPANLPQLDATLISDNNLGLGEIYTVIASLDNAGGFHAAAPSVNLSVPSGHVIMTPNPVSFPRVEANGSRTRLAQWRVRAPNINGIGNVIASATSSCWGETWSDSSGRQVQVNQTSADPRLRVSFERVTTGTVDDGRYLVRATVRNEGSSGADAGEVTVELNLPGGFEIVQGDVVTLVPSLVSGASLSLVWTIQSQGAATGNHFPWVHAHTTTPTGSILRGTGAGKVVVH